MHGFGLSLPWRGKKHVVARANVEAVEAADTPVKIDGLLLSVDASALAGLFAESATGTVLTRNGHFEQGKPRHETQKGANRTNQIAVKPAPGPREPDDDAECPGPDQNCGDALRGEVNGIDPIQVERFRESGKEVVRTENEWPDEMSENAADTAERVKQVDKQPSIRR